MVVLQEREVGIRASPVSVRWHDRICPRRRRRARALASALFGLEVSKRMGSDEDDNDEHWLE
eukprot:SAG31_NODE_580_length_13940_cov_16.175349_7_plen_62_part_00